MTDPLFELYRGDDHALRMEITDDAGTPIDLTGWMFKATVKLRPDTPDSEAPVSVDIPALDNMDAQAGVVYIELPHDQTENLLPGLNLFDVQREFNGKVTTVVSGRIRVLADVTRRVG